MMKLHRILNCMKKCFIFYVLSICMALLNACSDDDVSVSPTSISDLSVQTLIMGEGMESTIEFSVIPDIAGFNYDVSSSKCQIKLESINAW